MQGKPFIHQGLLGEELTKGRDYHEPPQFKLLCDDDSAWFLRHYYNTMAARKPDICDRSNLVDALQSRGLIVASPPDGGS
eukprot:COSAG02_NODE_1231_length_13766_cov_16.546572_12_plen_80_part_00